MNEDFNNEKRPLEGKEVLPPNRDMLKGIGISISAILISGLLLSMFMSINYEISFIIGWAVVFVTPIVLIVIAIIQLVKKNTRLGSGLLIGVFIPLLVVGACFIVVMTSL